MKKISYVFVGLLVLVLALLFLTARNTSDEAALDETGGSSPDSWTANKGPANEADIKSSQMRADSQSEPSNEVPSGAEALQFDEETGVWLKERGFTDEYNMYFLNQEFLENQVLAGDMLAAQMLGYQMLGSEEGDSYLEAAVRWGSVQALHFLSESYKAKADGRVELEESAESVSDLRNEYGMRALAYLFVSDIRGAGGMAKSAVEQLKEEIAYTDEDIVKACELAEALYHEFEQARESEGLEPFDNSPIPETDTQSARAEHCQ